MAEGEMMTNIKEAKRVGKVLINALGFLSFLFGSLMLLAIIFGTIGSMFMSTKPLFHFKRAKRNEDESDKKQKGQEGLR